MSQSISWDFFIAHAGADNGPAEQLYEMLVADSRVFLDSRCLQLGDDWDVKLAQAQMASAITVVIVSERTDAAYYQREEIAAAIALARENAGIHRVIPIFLAPERDLRAPLPYGLRLKHGITLGELVSLSDAAKRLLDLLRDIQDREASAFLFANYVSQLTSPNLTVEDRQSLANAMRALPGLPDSWYASIKTFFNLDEVWDLVERIAPESVVKERKALLLGLHLRSFENTLRRREANLMPKCAEQFLIALSELDPPASLVAQVSARVNAAISDSTCEGVEVDIVPPIYSWLRARGRRGLTKQ